VLWTVFKSREYSPEELASFTDQGDEEYQNIMTPEEHVARGKRQIRLGLIVIAAGVLLTWLLGMRDLEKELFIVSVGIAAAGVFALAAGLMQSRGRYENGFVTVINDFGDMPKTMKQLAVVQFFSWFPLFAMWIYTTAAVTKHIYGATDTTSQMYNDGADWVTVCFGVYNGVAALVAFGLPVLAKKTNRRITHMVCLIAGGLGMLSIYFIQDPNMLLVSMIGIGIAWASILSMPYAMLAGALPADKMGYYMGVFNYFIVLPQLVAASILGVIVGTVFDGEAIYALVIGGIVMILAGLFTLRVDDVDEV
jgi:maltose/moltooligosaccharide transporter